MKQFEFGKYEKLVGKRPTNVLQTQFGSCIYYTYVFIFIENRAINHLSLITAKLWQKMVHHTD